MLKKMKAQMQSYKNKKYLCLQEMKDTKLNSLRARITIIIKENNEINYFLHLDSHACKIYFLGDYKYK